MKIELGKLDRRVQIQMLALVGALVSGLVFFIVRGIIRQSQQQRQRIEWEMPRETGAEGQERVSA